MTKRAMNLTAARELVRRESWTDKSVKMSEVIDSLYEQGYVLERNQETGWVTDAYISTSPTSVVCELRTACGASRYVVMLWPLPPVYYVAMPKPLQLRADKDFEISSIASTVREFELDRWVRNDVQQMTRYVYKEKL